MQLKIYFMHNLKYLLFQKQEENTNRKLAQELGILYDEFTEL